MGSTCENCNFSVSVGASGGQSQWADKLKLPTLGEEREKRLREKEREKETAIAAH